MTDSTTGQQQQLADTMMILCPACDSDAAETLGVTGRPGDPVSASVILNCAGCDAVYQSPHVDSGASSGDVLVDTAIGRVTGKVKRDIPPSARFLSAGGDKGTVFRHSGENNRYDLILLPQTLENADNPPGVLRRVADLLDDGGRIELVNSNAGSSCFNVFGGRHWAGYRHPVARQQFRKQSLVTMASCCGLTVTRSYTASGPEFWLQSMQNWLCDWQAPRVLIAVATGPWLLPWLLAAFVEFVAALRGRGSVLVTSMEKEPA